MTQIEKFEAVTGMSIEAMKEEAAKLSTVTTTTPVLQALKARIADHFSTIPQTFEAIDAELSSMGFVMTGEAKTNLWHNNKNLARFESLHRSNPFEIKAWRAMFKGTSGRYGGMMYYTFMN